MVKSVPPRLPRHKLCDTGSIRFSLEPSNRSHDNLYYDIELHWGSLLEWGLHVSGRNRLSPADANSIVWGGSSYILKLPYNSPSTHNSRAWARVFEGVHRLVQATFECLLFVISL